MQTFTNKTVFTEKNDFKKALEYKFPSREVTVKERIDNNLSARISININGKELTTTWNLDTADTLQRLYGLQAAVEYFEAVVQEIKKELNEA